VGITAGSREVPGRNACDRRHTYSIIIIIIIIILTDKTITFNRPDVIFMNKKTKNTFLIDVAVPNTHNLDKIITDKKSKYQELANEICAMWKQKASQLIPIVLSSTGVIPKSLSQSLTTLNLHPQYINTPA